MFRTQLNHASRTSTAAAHANCDCVGHKPSIAEDVGFALECKPLQFGRSSPSRCASQPNAHSLSFSSSQTTTVFYRFTSGARSGPTWCPRGWLCGISRWNIPLLGVIHEDDLPTRTMLSTVQARSSCLGSRTGSHQLRFPYPAPKRNGPLGFVFCAAGPVKTNSQSLIGCITGRGSVACDHRAASCLLSTIALTTFGCPFNVHECSCPSFVPSLGSPPGSATVPVF